jgi:D-arabinose 1-dehydrogenase-like Zn-dependent alcohol dehydrogenase
MVLPDDIDMVATAPLFCAGITGTLSRPSHVAVRACAYPFSAYHAVKQCSLKASQWLAVIGCGGLGHLGESLSTAGPIQLCL